MNGEISQEILDMRGDIKVVFRGEDGLSAYEVAVKNGFVGTEEEWLESLKGEAERAEQYTLEVQQYWQRAKESSIEAGNYAAEAATYRNEAQEIKDSFAPEVADARAMIQAEKEEAEQKKLLVDEAAEQAHLDRVQADADAEEVRYLYNETIGQKNVATDAAERARRYAEGAVSSREAAEASAAAALTSETKAATSEANAANSEANAATSEANAAESEANAATSEANAAESEANASSSEANAAASATAAALSQAATDEAMERAEELTEELTSNIESATALNTKLDLGILHVNTLATAMGYQVTQVATDLAEVTELTEENRTMHSDVSRWTIEVGGYKADVEQMAATVDEQTQQATNAAERAGDAATIVDNAISIISENTLAAVNDALDTKLGKTETAVNSEKVNNLTVETAVPPNAVFTDTTYEQMTDQELDTGTETTGRVVAAHTIATFVLNVLADVINSAPAALDTLEELAAAINDDPDFHVTVMNEIGKKLSKSGDTMTGNLFVQGTVTADSLSGPLAGNVTGNVTGNLIGNVTGNVSGSSGSCTGNAATATTAAACTGNAATATKLATARTINIQDATATNTGTGASFDGSGNATIKLPATIKANITGNVSGSSGSCTGNAATATKATQDGSGNNIVNTYVNMTSAQTISGVKTFTGRPILTDGLTCRVTDTNSTTTRDAQVIHANSSNTAYGINLAIGGSGNAIIGGGESYSAQLSALAGNSAEDLYLTADGNIYLKSNCNTFANAKTITLNTSGELSGLAKVTSTSFVGALTGNVTGNVSGSSGSCTGNAASATTAAACTGNAASATTAAACTGNAATATKAGTLTTARTIDGVSFNGSANILHYGSCSTAAATAAKVVACTGFTLATGARIIVKFTITNTAANPTLNVNSTGAKAIYYRGAAISAGYLAANRTYEFVYNGTQFELVGDIDTNTNTDTLMTQNVASTNSTYPVLMCPTANATANQGAKTGIFSAKAVLNASNGQMKLNSKVVPVVSSWDSTTGVLALVSSGS